MSYIVITAVSLIIGFAAGFLFIAILTSSNDDEEELKQEIILLKEKNKSLSKKNQNLKEQNQEMEDQFLSLINNGKYNDTSNTI